MDNVTHSLTGFALSRAGLERFCPRAVFVLMLSANAPDIDIVALSGGGLRYLEAHRGYTHSVLLLPLLAVLPVLAVAAVFRERLAWRKAWLLSCAGIASHLLIDWTNTYGVRLFLPASSRWYYLDLNSLYDAWILAVLLLAALWPLFALLVNREIGDRSPAGRGIAIFALVFFLLFDCGRAFLHQQALNQLNSRLYADAAPVQTAAFPDAFSPLRWTGAVETINGFLKVDINVLEQFDGSTAVSFFKPLDPGSLERVKRIESFRYFSYFARFPIWSETPVDLPSDQGKRIELTDLRFGVPSGGAFHCVALENDRGQILESGFTYGSGADLGWGKTR